MYYVLKTYLTTFQVKTLKFMGEKKNYKQNILVYENLSETVFVEQANFLEA